MVLSEDCDESVDRRYQEVCADLNMDRNTSEEAWQSFKQISTNYTLEGDKQGWLACALYVACRKSVVPTVSRGNFVEGNCVSLTRLLRSSKLSLIQFFKLMKKWSDMANLPPDLRSKVDRIERNFAVSTVIFKKYEPIYNDIFKDPATDPARPPRGRKQKRLPCSSSELFAFCWTMFVKVKANYSQISDDLVNSYHLLLSIMDLIFANILLANRKEILNHKFSGLPDNFESDDYVPPTTPPCIIQLLCQRHDGLVIEAKTIKEHWCRPRVKRLFENKILRGNVNDFSGLVDPVNFEANSKAINKQYEEYVLSGGDFDERIFLGYDANAEIGTARHACPGELSEKIQLKRKSINEHVETAESLTFPTPLTGKRYLEEKEIGNITPVSTATQSVNKLQTLLSGCKTSPSDNLLKIFSECSRDPTQKIITLIKDMGESFTSAYSAPSEDHPSTQNDFARKRLQLGESLYFKILEKIVEEEKKHFVNIVDLSPLFERSMCHQSLFACCLEIVLFSYNSQRTFPWIIEVFEIPPYDFYKVIEILIRAEDGLSRDVVKNLNHIEEQILESLAWKADSPLWETIKGLDGPLPSVEEVSLPSQLENNRNPESTLLASPISHPAVRRLAGDRSAQRREISSPTANSPSSNATIPANCDTFHSPPAGTPTSAKRRLFAAAPTHNSSAANGNQPIVQSPGRTVSITLQTVQGENGVTYLPISSSALQSAISAATAVNLPISVAVEKKSPPVNNRPKKTGSLALFLRKVYHMGSVRLRDLCDKLGLVNEDLRKKIWTCFEYSLMHHTKLMMDRHLDQIMMCAIYVMAKVTKNDQNFQDIMKCYRMQPQAASHVYRGVLLVTRSRQVSGSSENSKNGINRSESNSPVSSEKDEEKDSSKDSTGIRSSSTLSVLQGSQPPTPTRLAGTGSSFEYEDRGDIITFYNNIYVKLVTKFVLQFSAANRDNRADTPPLSPLPLKKSNPMSPFRRVSNKHSVFISPLKSTNFGRSPSKQLSYSFNKSPRKDLDAINKMVLKEHGLTFSPGVKRVLSGDGSDSGIQAKRNRPDITLRKIQSVINERQNK